MDYLCDCKADLYAITETWLMEDDAAVRAELNLDGYNFLDHPREGQCGGGTSLIFPASLRFKKVEAVFLFTVPLVIYHVFLAVFFHPVWFASEWHSSFPICGFAAV